MRKNLFAVNRYYMPFSTPGLLKQEDFELQSFYLCDLKKPLGLVVSPSSKVILGGAKAMKSKHDSERVSNNGLLKRVGSFFIWLLGGSLGYLDKYSHVVYDGDRLTVYGTLSYNTASERWEMKNPIAILLQGENP